MAEIIFKCFPHCAVQLEPDLTPFSRQVVNLTLVPCTGFNMERADLSLCLIFTQKPRNNKIFEQVVGTAFALILDKFPQNPLKFYFT